MEKIPKIYLDEFLKQQTTLIKNRIRLAAILFVATFFTGTVIGTAFVPEGMFNQLILSWALAGGVAIITIALSKRISTFRGAKLAAAVFMVAVLAVLTRHYTVYDDPPFNAAMAYIFIFFGFSLIFPWHPHEIIGVAALHASTYIILILLNRTYFYKGQSVVTQLPDCLQGFIIMFLSFWVCFVVIKSEREREAENFILLKKVEKNNKQMRDELELATRVHSRILPHSANTPLGDIAVTYKPAYYMGGDYGKFYQIDKNKLVFIICDVTGHGVSAALLVNALNTEFESLAKEGKSPGDLLKEMDHFIVDDFAGVNMYLTAFCGLLDYSHFSRKFIYSSYGHPPQYIYRATDFEIKKIPAQTSLLGLPLKDRHVYENEIPFQKGDKILLFTDGVTEAKNAEDEQYGASRLEDFIKKHHGLEAKAFNQELLKELNAFTRDKLQDDVFIFNLKTK